jgi:cytochrome c oxidase subunit III
MAAVAEHRQPVQAPPHQALSTGLMGMYIFLSSEIMFFGSLFAVYFYLHGSFDNWPPRGTFPVDPWPIPTFNTVILLSSGVTMHIGHLAVQEGNRRKLIQWLIPTIVLGALFEVGQAYEFIHAYGGFGNTHDVLQFNTNQFSSAFFAMTGFHGLHVLGGLVFLLLILWRCLKSHFTAEHHVGVAACAVYWHFVDLVWVFLFGILYVGVAFGL